MKKLLFTLSVIIISFSLISCDDDNDDKKRINFSEVPEVAKTFMTKHFTDFSENDVLYVEIDVEDYDTYEVTFKNGIEIDFYPNGVWKSIDLNGNLLPNSIAQLLPENSLTYISSNYPNAVIEEIEKTSRTFEESSGFKIELKDDRDIYFDSLGNVIRDKGQESQGKETANISDYPAIQSFLNTYFKGLTPIKTEKEWGKIEIEYSNDVEVEFLVKDKDATFKSIEAEHNPELMRNVIKGMIGSTAILDYLDKNHKGQTIEEFSIAAAGITIAEGYVVELDGIQDYKVYFDKAGTHLATVID